MAEKRFNVTIAVRSWLKNTSIFEYDGQGGVYTSERAIEGAVRRLLYKAYKQGLRDGRKETDNA